MKNLIFILVGVCSLSVWAKDEDPLEKEMQSLDVPNHPPLAVSHERLYATQTRYSPLNWRSEISAGVAENLSGNSFLNTEQVELNYRFHFNNSWAIGVGGAWVKNKFTDAARDLQRSEGMLPDVSYAKARYDLMLEYNLFYGKFRLSADKVMFFDQYWALGPGLEATSNGQVNALVADAGFAVWLGKWGSLRLGLKDYYYGEVYRGETTVRHNLHGHLDMGLLF